MAAANHKLTTVIAGRTISGTSHSEGKTPLTFDDGSQMTIKTAPSNANQGSTGGKVAKVRQSVDPPARSSFGAAARGRGCASLFRVREGVFPENILGQLAQVILARFLDLLPLQPAARFLPRLVVDIAEGD